MVVSHGAMLRKSLCKAAMTQWASGGGIGEPPCVTVTIELDGEPSNFYLASGLDLAAGLAGAPSGDLTYLTRSPLFATLTRGSFILIGAPTTTACEALRPSTRSGEFVVDGRCLPARLTIH